MQVFGVLLLLVLALSCGKTGSNAGLPKVNQEQQRKIIPLDGSNIAGLYMAKFITLNPHVNGTLAGSATIQRQDDKLFAYVRLFGGAPRAWHQQNIYEGTRCPDLNDDLNGDGYLDISETEKALGKILIPLDANLGTQKAGRNIYPMADESGGYFYERVTSFKRLFSDLKSDDKNLSDNVMKLLPDEGLDLEEKVVIVQGAPEGEFPESVASTHRRPTHQTLPITCGTFSKVTKIPGEVYEEGNIPGPIGEVEEPEFPESIPHDDSWEAPTPREEAPEEEPWYDRVFDWWRSRWESARGNRLQEWGEG